MKHGMTHCRPVSRKVGPATTNIGALFAFLTELLPRLAMLPSNLNWKVYYPPGEAPEGGGGNGAAPPPAGGDE